MTETRLVFDSNVLISGLLFDNSIPQKVFDYALTQAVVLLSEPTFQELTEVLIRPKFDRYVSLDKRLQLLSILSTKAEIIEIIETINDCRDPKDNKFLELAVNGKADYLITGDNDLLVLNPFKSIKILTPQAFLFL